MSKKRKVNIMSNPTSSPDLRQDDPLERRRFLAYFTGAGLTSTLFPGVLWARMQDRSRPPDSRQRWYEGPSSSRDWTSAPRSGRRWSRP